MLNQKLTLYQDINDLLADWIGGIKNILGPNGLGLYLTGSLAYGDFVPGRSDIDLYVALRIFLKL